MQYKNIKRIIDVLLSSSLIVVLAPIFIITSIIIKLGSKGPIIYKQERSGLYGRRFVIYKFRTMAENNDANNFSEKDKVTNAGKILRQMGVDELPQLFNILQGDMSFIGPRPFLPRYIKYYSEEQRKRLDVLPGLFGPTNCIYEDKNIFEKINMDINYVENYSFKTDMKLLTTFINNFKNIIVYRKISSCGNKDTVIEELNDLEVVCNEAYNKEIVKIPEEKKQKYKYHTAILSVEKEACYNCDYYWYLNELVATQFEKTKNNCVEKSAVLVKRRCQNYK